MPAVTTHDRNQNETAMNEKVYLKANVVAEPLIARWYAWTHLISPATAAMNVVGRHLSIMSSYVQAPHVHAAAAKNPDLLGGPFMSYDRPRVAEVRALIAETKRRQAPLLDLAKAIKDLGVDPEKSYGVCV